MGRPPRALRERQGPGNPRWGPPSGTCGNAGLLGGMSATEEPLSRSHAARHEATQPQHRGAEQGGARPRSPPPWHPPLPSAPGGSAGQGRRGEEPPARRGVAALRSERPRNAASLTERHQSLHSFRFLLLYLETQFRLPPPEPRGSTSCGSAPRDSQRGLPGTAAPRRSGQPSRAGAGEPRGSGSPRPAAARPGSLRRGRRCPPRPRSQRPAALRDPPAPRTPHGRTERPAATCRRAAGREAAARPRPSVGADTSLPPALPGPG